MPEFLARPFWNDGGPLLIVPQAAMPYWDGGDPPSGGRVIAAKSRWNHATDPACDYDRACDVDPESAGILDIGRSWGVVIGTAAGQSAQWLPGTDARTFYAVGVEAADDTTTDRLLSLVAAPGDWRMLTTSAEGGPEGLLLLHAASRPSEVRELQATARSLDEGAVIGDGLRYPAPAGEYAVAVRDIATPDGDYLTFIRFSQSAAAA